MAPKRQRFVGSSSTQPDFDEGFDEKRFVSSIGQSEYNRLRTKVVAKERGFKPSATDGELLAMITERGWGLFCDTPPDVPLGIVREFYANAAEAANGYSWVRDVTVDYRSESIRTLLRLPARPRAEMDWGLVTRDLHALDLDDVVARLCVPGTVWKLSAGTNEKLSFPASRMNRYAQAWNKFICAKLMPSTHSHDVTVDRALLLYGILTGGYVGVDDFIYRSMLRFMSSRSSGAIPYASIITQLCVAAGVRWGAEEQLQQQTVDIDSAGIARLVDWPGGVPHPRGLGYLAEGAEAPPQVPRAPRAASVGSSRAGPSQGIMDMTVLDTYFRGLNRKMDAMTRRMDAMHVSSRQYSEDMAVALDAAFQSPGTAVQWPIFGARTQYPPGSPPEEGDDIGQ